MVRGRGGPYDSQAFGAMESLQGHLLIASPQLRDPNFFHSVVLMIQHGGEGALGVVLNRPMEMTIQDAWPQVSGSPCNAEGPLHEGGPCDGPLLVLHTDSTLSQTRVCDGVYFNTEKESIERLVARSAGPLKFFVNYAGWAPDQLEREIAAGGWVTTPAGQEQIFGDDGDLWPAALRLASRRSRLAGIDPKLIPDDPSVN